MMKNKNNKKKTEEGKSDEREEICKNGGRSCV